MSKTRLEALKYYKGELLALNIMSEDEAAAEAKHALSWVIGCDISALYLYGNTPVTDTELYRMDRLLEKRATGCPLAYIMGERWFMGLRFIVTPDVLIPRQETELLAETAIGMVRYMQCASVLDMCTGSGCVALSVAKYSRARVTAADISPAALEVAKKNAESLGVKAEFIESDLFSNINGSYDIITANPPYVSKEVYNTLMPEVRLFEPKGALISSDSGLAFYKRIARACKAHLNKGGSLLLEIGDEQGRDVKNILEENGFSDVSVRKDYSGNDRLASGVIK